MAGSALRPAPPAPPASAVDNAPLEQLIFPSAGAAVAGVVAALLLLQLLAPRLRFSVRARARRARADRALPSR